MGQMANAVRASGQISNIFGSGFNSAVNRIAALDLILEQNPDAVFEIDLAIFGELIGHFEL